MKILEYISKNKEKTPDFRDFLMILGLGMTLKGLYMIFPPIMWIGGGVFIIYLGWPKER